MFPFSFDSSLFCRRLARRSIVRSSNITIDEGSGGGGAEAQVAACLARPLRPPPPPARRRRAPPGDRLPRGTDQYYTASSMKLPSACFNSDFDYILAYYSRGEEYPTLHWTDLCSLHHLAIYILQCAVFLLLPLSALSLSLSLSLDSIACTSDICKDK